MALPDNRTKDGFDVQMQTNQLSHFLLTSTVWPSIVKATKTRGAARVVMHSSSSRFGKKLAKKYFEKCEAGKLGGDWAPTMVQMTGLVGGPWARYQQSKLANANFAMALHDKLQASGDETLKKIQANAADPGLASSGLITNTMKDGDGVSTFIAKYFASQSQSAADGSLPVGTAAFGKGTKSGSLFMPEKDFVGPPIASVEEGVATKKKTAEKMIVLPKNKENVWKFCEEALDIKFAVE